MTDENLNYKAGKDENTYSPNSIGLGLVFGAGIGVIFNHLAIGAGLGMLFSILIAGIMDEAREDLNRSAVRVMAISLMGAAIILLIPKIIACFL